jgi:hypothetical protein
VKSFVIRTTIASAVLVALATGCSEDSDDRRIPAENVLYVPRGEPADTRDGIGSLAMESKNCVNNLKKLHLALLNYKKMKGKHRFFPRFKGEMLVASLFRSGVLQDANVLLCPATTDDNHNGVDLGGMNSDLRANVDPGLVSYTGINNNKGSPVNILKLVHQKKIPPSQVPVIWDKKGNHLGYRHVLFLDGHIDKVADDEFEEKYARYGK